jgi:Transglutaminase-like superfamily
MRIGQLTNKSKRLVVGASRKIAFHPAEALLLCRMALWVGVLSIATRLYPLPRALSMVAADNSNSQPLNDSDIQQRLASAIDQLLSIDLFIFKPICWKRAAILHRYLSLNGITSRIVFGVRNDDGKVSGHAWLENDAGPILESDTPNYVVTYSFPSDSPCKTEVALLSGK